MICTERGLADGPWPRCFLQVLFSMLAITGGRGGEDCSVEGACFGWLQVAGVAEAAVLQVTAWLFLWSSSSGPVCSCVVRSGCRRRRPSSTPVP
eukprot:11898506-Alexandrium_andersonii.AAC.1